MRFKKIIAALLATALTVSVTACDKGNSGGVDGGSDGGDEQTTTAATTEPLWQEFETDENIQQAAQEKAGDLDDIDVTKKIIWLNWSKLKEATPAAELFKAKYGVPAEGGKSDGSEADSIFEFRYIAYEERYTELAKEIVSGDAPDIFQFEVSNYPYSIYTNLFQPIDDVIDLEKPEWDETRDTIKLFEWGGKNYCPIISINTSDLLWYRNSVVQEAGLDDPYELYQGGNWNWNTFLEMCERFSDTENKKYCLDGWNPENNFVCSTGMGLVSLENGKLKSNLNDANIERAINVLSTLCKEDYRYPRHEINDWQISYAAFAAGDTLFFSDGSWRFDENWSKYRDRFEWGDDEMFFVPFPKDPNASEYYFQGKQDAFMLCKGSQNIEGYKAWINCSLLSARDPETKALDREQRKKEYGWTDEQLDFLESLVVDLIPVFDFKNGIGEDIATTTSMDNPVEMLTKYVYLTGLETYTQMREANAGVINQRIEEMNQSVS